MEGFYGLPEAYRLPDAFLRELGLNVQTDTYRDALEDAFIRMTPQPIDEVTGRKRGIRGRFPPTEHSMPQDVAIRLLENSSEEILSYSPDFR